VSASRARFNEGGKFVETLKKVSKDWKKDEAEKFKSQTRGCCGAQGPVSEMKHEKSVVKSRGSAIAPSGTERWGGGLGR